MAINAAAVKEYQSVSETATVEELWQIYAKTKSPAIKEKLLVHYLPTVKYVVGRMLLSLPNSVNYDDLVSAGTMGLLSAIDRFDVRMGVKFETYVVPRIRGAILDELRSLDWVPRSIRSKARKLEKAIATVEAQLGRMATAEEIARELEMTLEEYEDMLTKIGGHSVSSLDRELYDTNEGSGSLYDLIKNVKADDPAQKIEKEELKQKLIEFLNELPENERLVLALYYYEELTLKEIGLVMGVSESRVSQIHTKAIDRLKVKLKDYF